MVLATEDINIIAELEGSTGVKLHNERQKLRNRFDIVRKLGKGTYGKVHLAVNKDTGEEVAIKTIRKSKIETKQDLVRIQREIQIMSSVQHPHIIHIYEVFENKEKIVLVMEYASGGELYDYLNDKKCLDENEARRVFRQVVAAVYYCHKNMICHRDLKLENILLDENKNAKIADFGLSNIFDDKNFLDTFCGSPLYSSPEIVQGKPYYGPEVDCWSLGVLLYTLVYAAMPFDGSNFVKLVKQISEGDYYEPKELSDASNLIRKMLNVSPTKRANIDDICSDRWVDAGEDVSLVCVAQEFCNRIPVRLDYLLTLSAADGSQRSPGDESLSDQRLSDIISSTESGIKLEDHLESDADDNNIAEDKRLEDDIELEKVDYKVAAVCENPKLMMDDIDVEEPQLEDQPQLDDIPSETEDIDEECENLKDTVVCMKDFLSNGTNRSGNAMNKISSDAKLSEITVSPPKHVVSRQPSQVSAGEVTNIPETQLEESSKQLVCYPVRRSPTKEDLCNNERRGSIEIAPLRVVSNYGSADEVVNKPQVVFVPRDKGGFTLVGVKSEVKFDMKQGQPTQPALPAAVRQAETTLKGDNKVIKYVATVKKHCQDVTQPSNNPERVTLLKITCTPSEGASGMTVSASTDNTKEHWGYNVYRSKHRTIRKYRSVVEHQVGSVDDESDEDKSSEKRDRGVERCDSFGSTGSNDGFEDNFESLNSDALLSNLLSRTRHFIQRFGGSRIGVSTNSSGTAFSINSPGRYLLTTTVQPQRSRATALNNESMRYRQSTSQVSQERFLDEAPGWERQQSQYLNYLANPTRPSQQDSRIGSAVDGGGTSPIKFQLRHLKSTGSELAEGIHCNVFSSSAGNIQPHPHSIFSRSSFREATTGQDQFATRPLIARSHHLPMDSSGSVGNATVHGIESPRRHRLSSQIECSLNGEPFFNYSFMPGQHTSPTSSNYRDPLQSWDVPNSNGQSVSQSFSSLMDSLESPRDVLQKAMELCDSLRKVE